MKITNTVWHWKWKETLNEAKKVKEEANSGQGLVDFIVRSKEIEGYNLDPGDVKEAVEA